MKNVIEILERAKNEMQETIIAGKYQLSKRGHSKGMRNAIREENRQAAIIESEIKRAIKILKVNAGS